MDNIKYKSGHFIGIDIGATHTKFAVIGRNNEIKDEEIFNTKEYSSGKLLSILTDKAGTVSTKFKIKAVGIGVAGPVDIEKGEVHYFVNRPDWNNVELRDIFEKKTGLDTFIDNDANLMALAEHRLGAGRNYNNIICLTLGSGVGGGIILDGKLYRGINFVAGEIGHIPINIDGPGCRCGGKGCLERYVGNEFIKERLVSKIKDKKHSNIMKLVKNDESKITPKVIDKACKRGDVLARQIWVETGQFIGMALVGVVNLLNPEVIIVGGGVAKTGKLLLDSIYDTIKEYAMSIHKKNIKVLPAKLGEKAGVIGAAILAKENILIK